MCVVSLKDGLRGAHGGRVGREPEEGERDSEEEARGGAGEAQRHRV